MTIYRAETHPLIGMTYAPELALLDLIEVNDDIDRIEESFVMEELGCAYYHVREQFKAWRNRDSACYAP